MTLLKTLGLYTFLVLAGAVVQDVASRDSTGATLADAERACSERVIDAELKQGEAAEHAYNVGKEEMANTILSLCNEDGKIKLDGAVLICELVIGKEI